MACDDCGCSIRGETHYKGCPFVEILKEEGFYYDVVDPDRDGD